MEHIDSNPMKLVSTPIVERVDSTLKVWTMDQMRRFLSTVSDDHFYPSGISRYGPACGGESFWA